MKLEIIFENKYFLIINKPTNLHSVALKDKKNTSVASLLLERYPYLAEISNEAGLVQRLDYETTGCLLCAKTKPTYLNLKNQIKNKLIRKEYIIIVDNIFNKEETVISYIGSRYRGSKKVLCLKEPEARLQYAKTIFFPLQTIPQKNISFVLAKTQTGRRHQIRSQIASLGFPLCGDALYGSKQKLTEKFDLNEKIKFYLHAKVIIFTDPQSGKEITFEAENPYINL